MTGKPTDAAVAMVLKRHEDAVRDGDNILAIVKIAPQMNHAITSN